MGLGNVYECKAGISCFQELLHGKLCPINHAPFASREGDRSIWPRGPLQNLQPIDAPAPIVEHVELSVRTEDNCITELPENLFANHAPLAYCLFFWVSDPLVLHSLS